MLHKTKPQILAATVAASQTEVSMHFDMGARHYCNNKPESLLTSLATAHMPLFSLSTCLRCWSFINLCDRINKEICIYHIFHVGSLGVHLTSKFVMQVQDRLHVALTDGSLPTLFRLPPVTVLIHVLLQQGAQVSGVGQHHGNRGLENDQDAQASQPFVW